VKISGSILSAPNVKEGIEHFSNTDVDYLHLDITDGTMSEVIKDPYHELKKELKNNQIPLDIHIMSEEPSTLLKKYLKLNPDIITIQVEIKEDIEKRIDFIRKKYPQTKIGLSLTTNSKISELYKYLDIIDHILIMGVELGIGGSKMTEGTIKKVIDTKEYLKEIKKNKTISVDGGINDKNIKNLSVADIDIAVVGNFITSANSYQEAINKLKEKIK